MAGVRGGERIIERRCFANYIVRLPRVPLTLTLSPVGEREPEKSMTMNDTSPAPLTACPACGCRDLFIRKDFPQKLGLAIVGVAGVAFLVLAAWRTTFYLGVWILIAAAA